MSKITVKHQAVDPPPPASGETTIFSRQTGKRMWGITDTGIVFPLGGTVGGLRLDDSISSPGLTSITGTGSDVFTSNIKLNFTPANGPYTGTFLLLWYSEFSHDTVGGDTEVRIHRTDVGPTQIAFNEEQADDGDDWNTFSGFSDPLALTAESPTFQMQFRTAQPAQSALIRQARALWVEVLA